MSFSLFGAAYPFRGLFLAQAAHLVAAAHHIGLALEDLPSAMSLGRDIEALGVAGRAASSEVLRQLALVGIRPIDRGDVQSLDLAFTEAAAAIDAVAVRLSLFRPTAVHGPAREVAARVTAMAREVEAEVARLARQGPDEAAWGRVSRARSEGAGLVAVGLGGLYEEAEAGRASLLEVLAWSQLYDRLEAAVHRTARLAEVLHGVLLKQD